MIKKKFKTKIGIIVAIISISVVLWRIIKPLEIKTIHFTEREQPIQHLVIHSFSLSVPEMIKRLNELGVSTHYLIDINGHITLLVPEDKVAWHAGKSYWRGNTGLNATSIGIELQNDTLGQTPFPAAQIKAFQKLSKSIIKRYHINPRNIVAHSDIAPKRKVDVGKAFPWQEMAKAGIGIWPRAEMAKPTGQENTAALLAQIGYDITDIDKALLAFERRFMPEVVATDTDISHLEENLPKVRPVKTLAVQSRLVEVARAFQ